MILINKYGVQKENGSLWGEEGRAWGNWVGQG